MDPFATSGTHSRRRSDYAPFVSIIVPAYNEELVIKNTIDSLLASDYENYEIIVVDDGSQDKTSEVVSENFVGERARQAFYRRECAAKQQRSISDCDMREVKSSSRSMPTRCLRRKQSAHWRIGSTIRRWAPSPVTRKSVIA